jgi:hypothetical protein
MFNVCTDWDFPIWILNMSACSLKIEGAVTNRNSQLYKGGKKKTAENSRVSFEQHRKTRETERKFGELHSGKFKIR